MSKVMLAVYGSMKKGFENHYFVEDQEFIGEATVPQLYIHTSKYPFPVLRNIDHPERGTEAKNAHCEVYAVDEARFAEIHEFETKSGIFAEVEVVVEMNDSKEIIWVHTFKNSILYEDKVKYTVLMSGNWEGN